MRNRHLPITIVTIALLAVGVAGYLAPSPDQGPPVRVLLANPGGNVFFTHQQHAEEYGTECGDCHHQSETFQAPPACASCHPGSFDQQWIVGHQKPFQDKASCRACHHARFDALRFDHAAHEEYADCQACHHGPDVEPTPTRCSDCHQQQGDDDMPGLMDAAHQRCRDCHQAMFDAKPATDGCSNCHELNDPETLDKPYARCSRCHDRPVKQLVPTTGDAFHQQCMGCHKDQGAGPYGQNACNQCHR